MSWWQPLLACSAGVLALLVDLESLAELVSIGTLFVFFMLSAAVLWRRYYDPNKSNMGTAARLAMLCILALGESKGHQAVLTAQGCHVPCCPMQFTGWI